MKKLFNVVKNLMLMSVVMFAAIVIMPNEVKAAGSVLLSPTSLSIGISESGSTTITYSLEAGESIKWETEGSSLTDLTPGDGSAPSSGDSIRFKGAVAGTTTIKATVYETANPSNVISTATCDVTVGASNEITVAASPASIKVGDTSTITASGVSPYAIATPVTWSVVSGSEYITMPSGITAASITVTGKAVGTATVRATDNNGVSKECSITVTGTPATGITINQGSSKTIDLSTDSNYIDLTATITPAGSDSPITWSSSNTGVATISSTSGTGIRVTAVGCGTTNITATANGHTATYVLTVKNLLQAISFSSDTITIGQGQEAIVTVITTPAAPDPRVSFSATPSNGNVTIISATENSIKIKGIAPGTSTVTVTPAGDPSYAAKAKSFNVTVKAAVDSTTTLADSFITTGFSRDMTKMLTIKPDGALYDEGKIEWKSSSESVATIDPRTGIVTGKSTGTTTITANIYNFGIATPITKTSTLTVVGKPTITYNSNRTLSVNLPTKAASGSDANVNITDVKGGYIVVYLDGNEIGNSGDKYYGSGTSFTVPADFAEKVVSDNQSKFSGEKDITFKVFPYGTKESDSGSKTRNDSVSSDAATAKVYKLTVTGNCIKSTSTYALNGTSIQLTATPETNYAFSKWSDGSTTNPRTFVVNGSATYTAEAKNAANSAAGSANGGAGSKTTTNSKYDKVPKTGEDNAVMWLWICLGSFILVAGVAGIYVMNPELVSKIFKKSGE